MAGADKIVDILGAEKKPLTLNSLLAIVAGVLLVIGYTVAIYSWVNGIDRKVDELITEKTALVQRRDEQVADLKNQTSELRAWKETFSASVTTKLGAIDSKLDVEAALLERIEHKLEGPTK